MNSLPLSSGLNHSDPKPKQEWTFETHYRFEPKPHLDQNCLTLGMTRSFQLPWFKAKGRLDYMTVSFPWFSDFHEIYRMLPRVTSATIACHASRHVIVNNYANWWLEFSSVNIRYFIFLSEYAFLANVNPFLSRSHRKARQGLENSFSPSTWNRHNGVKTRILFFLMDRFLNKK